ncbi:MAG TPA: hypothetical protein DCL35_00130 [Candidatus Omnitrophica bacterium]|nr:hypothetical protein [Candidatus Omnitrophota bacterium]
MLNPLKGKKILITAGPTWVPIDDVRVISNVSSGELGLLLAKNALKYGADIDLLLGPVSRPVPLDKKIRITRFTYFDELHDKVVLALKSNKYDVILHCAAVSDYLPRAVRGKISSEQGQLVLRLDRAPKIVDDIRRLAPEAFLVMFKLEGNVTDAVLLKRALEAMKRVGADLVIANRFINKKYRGFILGTDNILARTVSKPELAGKLFKALQEKLSR